MASKKLFRKIFFDVVNICWPPGPKLSIAGVKSFVSCLQRKIYAIMWFLRLYRRSGRNTVNTHSKPYPNNPKTLPQPLSSHLMVTGPLSKKSVFSRKKIDFLKFCKSQNPKSGAKMTKNLVQSVFFGFSVKNDGRSFFYRKIDFWPFLTIFGPRKSSYL